MKFLSALWKELLEISHDRTMLLVLVVFPIFIMLFMGSSFRVLEINGLPIGVVGPQNTSFSAMLLKGLNDSKAFNLQSYETESEALADFRNGQLKAIIVIPEDFETTLNKGNGSRIKIEVDNSDLALEQSVLAAMSAVVQASSADITKAYVSGAWDELGTLNRSAGKLGSDLEDSRKQMQKTKTDLQAIKKNMDESNLSAIEGALEGSSQGLSSLQGSLDAQREMIHNVSSKNAQFFNDTDSFLENASDAVDKSIATIQSSHSALVSQAHELNHTAEDLTLSISGLKTVKGSVSDPLVIAAIDLNIMSLDSLRNSTIRQISDAKNQTAELEKLNATLFGFKASLQEYSAALSKAKTGMDSSGSLAAIDKASIQLAIMNSSLGSIRSDISRLKDTMEGVRGSMTDIEGTLDRALNQTSSVDELIASLQDTVEEQTAKDPNMIASPLSIELQDQYVRTSYVDFLMPQVIAISLLFSCFLLASISLVREKTRNTIIRAMMMPYGLVNMVLGKVLSLIVLSIGQIAIILVVALFLFGVRPPSDIGMLLFGTVVSSLVLSSIGILIGFYARTESAAIQTCLLIAIPMLFLGNIIFSPDLLPNYTQILQQLLPLAHVTNIFKVVLITGGNPLVDIVALLTYFVLLVIVLGYILIKRRDISNYQ